MRLRSLIYFYPIYGGRVRLITVPRLMKRALIFVAALGAILISGLFLANYFPDETWKLLNGVRESYSALLAATTPPQSVPNQIPSPAPECLSKTWTQHIFDPKWRNSNNNSYCTPEMLVYRTATAKNGMVCQVRIESQFKGQHITESQMNTALNEVAPAEDKGKYVSAGFLNLLCPPENCSGVSEDYERMRITKIGSTNNYNYALVSYRRDECEKIFQSSQ